MQVQQINISTITPYQRNNRKHSDTQIKRIAEAIKNFGWTQPLVLDSKNEIIIGHGRYFAAQQMGLKEVPAIVLNGKLTQTEIKALRILDNKLQNDSEWNFENLESEIQALVDDNFDIAAWGLDAMLSNPIEGEEYDESIADDVNLCICPVCKHEHAKKK